MSYVINQSRKLLITQLKSELNYRLMMISARMQLTGMKSADITKQKAEIQNAQMEKLVANGAENITLQDVQNVAAMTSDLDVQLELLSIQDENMEAEMRMIETELNTLNAEDEQLDKAIDSSVKKEFGIFSSN